MSDIYFEDYSWYIKVSDEYSDTKYIEIVIDQNITDINDIFSIMQNRLPQGYSILDYENLYTLNDIPCEYWSRSQNSICFESISESDWGFDITYNNTDKTYFDTIIETF